MIDIRRIFTHVEQIHHEFGPVAATPLLRGAIGVVLTNPYAGRYEPDLLPMMNALQPLGIDMAERLRAAMGVPAQSIEGYGKGAIVGADGEQEHGAMWHVPGGYAMRAAWLERRPAGLRHGPGRGQDRPARQCAGHCVLHQKVGAPGTTLDVPLTHINASYVRSHFDAIEVRVPGAPLADEIVFILAMSTGPRVHARMAGLAASAISQWDGLR